MVITPTKDLVEILYKPDVKYKFFNQLSIFMATIEKYRNQVQKFAEFFFFFPHFWQLKPTVCKYVVFDISLSVCLFIYLFIYWVKIY